VLKVCPDRGSAEASPKKSIFTVGIRSGVVKSYGSLPGDVKLKVPEVNWPRRNFWLLSIEQLNWGLNWSAIAHDGWERFARSRWD
jgi:hypothetical protein